jgi:hypothetical protein
VDRKISIFFFVILSVSLITLGIRLPWPIEISSNSGKPKPHPRAVTQTQIKTGKQIVKTLSNSLAFIPKRSLTVDSFETGRIILILSVEQLSSRPQLSRSSRAPPSSSFSA